MRLPIPAGLAVATMALGMLPAALTAPADAASQAVPRIAEPTPPSGSGRLAESALATVEDAFSSHSEALRRLPSTGSDLTMALRDLRMRLGDLPAADQVAASRYLARPTGGFDPFVHYSQNAMPTSDCVTGPDASPHFCIHWARKTADAPPASDSDGDGQPDQVELAREVLDHVWDRVITQGGYKQPPKDGSKGGDSRFDVYLADIGDFGVYGYCVPETRQPNGTSYTGYCVLDNDYAPDQFPLHTREENLQVTAAHEFFHAVQFAYDAAEDTWLMEATATWMEDEIYDGVNDNVGYLRFSSMRHPARPLDSPAGLSVYGNWIWWRYLTELRFPRKAGGLPKLVRDVWERADNSGTAHYRFPTGRYSLRALEAALRARHSDLATELARFGVDSRRPRLFFDEGKAYPTAGLAADRRLTRWRPRTVGAVRLQHLSNKTVAFTPAPSLASRTLRIRVDVPPRVRRPVVEVTRVTADGAQPAKRVRLTRTGAGTVRLPHFGAALQRVELTLTNGGSRYRCYLGTSWSCQGRSQDNGLRFAYRAVARR